jgi:multiple sugar transport system substrate-binding protein
MTEVETRMARPVPHETPCVRPGGATPARRGAPAGPPRRRGSAGLTRRGLGAVAGRLAGGLSLLGAACAGTGAPGGAGPAGGGGPTELSGKLTIALVGDVQQHPPAILDGFKSRYPRLQVETIAGAWNVTLDKIAEMVAAGTPPDVWYGENGRATGWGPRGVIRDLANYVKRDLKEADHFPVAVPKDPAGKQWGVAGDLQVVALFYNTAAFDEVGLKPPTPDWKLDDLIEAARRLTDPGKRQFGFYSQPSYITTSWYLFPKLYGVGVLDETLTKSQFTHPKVQEALQALLGFADRGHAPPFVDQGKYPFAPSPNAEGRCAMSFGIYGAMAGPAYKDHTFDVELVPTGPAARWATVIANDWVIGKDSPAADAGWEWIKWHSLAEQQVLRAASGTGLPMHRKAADQVVSQAPAPPKNRRAFLKSLDFSGTLGENAVWQEWRTAAQDELLKAFRKEVPLPNTLQETHRLVQAELDKFYKK